MCRGMSSGLCSLFLFTASVGDSLRNILLQLGIKSFCRVKWIEGGTKAKDPRAAANVTDGQHNLGTCTVHPS